jgi:hypothetical protein
MNQEYSTGDEIDIFIGEMLKAQNRRLYRYGWIRQEDPDTTRYQKSTPYGELDIDIQKPSEFAKVKPGRVRAFSICSGVYDRSILGGGNEYFAAIGEASGEPGYINKRPMKRDELEELRQRFLDELRDFEQVRLPGLFNLLFPVKFAEKSVRKKLKGIILTDLDSYYQKALRILPEDWERYKLKEKQAE